MEAQRGSRFRALQPSNMVSVARTVRTPIVVLVDVWVGIAWLLLPAHYWSGAFYQPAHRLMSWLPYGWQFRAWGVLIIVLALGWFLRRPGHETAARLCVAGLVAVWCFWLVLTTYGWITANVGGLLPPLTFLALRAHWPGSAPRGDTRWNTSQSH